MGFSITRARRQERQTWLRSGPETDRKERRNIQTNLRGNWLGARVNMKYGLTNRRPRSQGKERHCARSNEFFQRHQQLFQSPFSRLADAPKPHRLPEEAKPHLPLSRQAANGNSLRIQVTGLNKWMLRRMASLEVSRLLKNDIPYILECSRCCFRLYWYTLARHIARDCAVSDANIFVFFLISVKIG